MKRSVTGLPGVMAVLFSACLILLAPGVVRAEADVFAPRRVSFDDGWRFHLGDVPGAQAPGFDDVKWQAVDVPHDWSITGPHGQDPSVMQGPFDAKSPAGHGGGYLDAGVGWYRKTFTLDSADIAAGRRLSIDFDGAYMDSEVWINGHSLGVHPYGFTGFKYDLTPFVHAGKPNVLAVRVNVTQPCCRWYSGAGIERHVWLVRTAPLHVAHWGVYVTTPEVSAASATIRVQTTLENQGADAAQPMLAITLHDPAGKTVATLESPAKLAAGAAHTFDQSLVIPAPQLWSLDTPRLYSVVAVVRQGGKAVDCVTMPFGIRTFRFTADHGFELNGKHVPIRGVCDHHDLGPLGAAVFRRGIERQLQVLKAMGCNAIRTSHNPPAPELLDLCDRMGFVVMDEAFDEWKASKTPNGYGRFYEKWSEPDLVSMIHRDRNHPSIVLWSIGNEIPEQGRPEGGAMARRLADICHREDPTRPVTSACNNPGGALKTGYAAALDVMGINYHIEWYKKARTPGRALIASETASTLTTRGEYDLTTKNGHTVIEHRAANQCSAYDLDHPGWGCTAETELMAMEKSPWIAGQFVWTGFDYIGEPTPYQWPSRSSYFGICDLCGFPKDSYYLYESQWTDRPMVHVLPHWNWPGREGTPIPVWCYSNADSVELLFNGKSLGRLSKSDRTRLHFEWQVPYTPGTLKTVARIGERVVATDEVHTAGSAARLVLLPDRDAITADGRDLSFVQVRVEDADGNLCPLAADEVRFTVHGPGRIAGLGNGDPTNHEPFQGTAHRVFHGLGLAILRSEPGQPGTVTLDAQAPGLIAAHLTLTTTAPAR